MGGNPGKPTPPGIGPTFCEAPDAELDVAEELLDDATEAAGFGIGIQREPTPPDSASQFIINYMCMFQGSQEQEVKFQDQIFSKFQDIFVHFMKLMTQKMHTLFTNQTETEMMSADCI